MSEGFSKVFVSKSYFKIHTICWPSNMQASMWFLTALQHSYLFACSSESWRSRWTRRTWFASLALYGSIWHFVSCRSTSDLSRLAQPAVTLRRGRNAWSRHWRLKSDSSNNNIELKDGSPFHPWDQGFQGQVFLVHPVIIWKDKRYYSAQVKYREACARNLSEAVCTACKHPPAMLCRVPDLEAQQNFIEINVLIKI